MNTHVHSELELEEPACSLCGCESRRLVASSARFLPFGVVRCCRCDLHYLSPRPAERWARALYAGSEYFGENEGIEGEPVTPVFDSQVHTPTARLTSRRLLRTLSHRGLTGGALLEVGCGVGLFLAEARRYFGRCEGTERSAAAALEAGKRSDGVSVGGIEGVPAVPTYDVVLSHQRIQHERDPVSFLWEQVQRVVPGGTIVATTPWMGSLWQRALREHWSGFQVPEHLHYFDRDTLRDAFYRAGLVEVQSVPHLQAFPLARVAQKLGVTLPDTLADASLWIPNATLAVIGRRSKLEG